MAQLTDAAVTSSSLGRGFDGVMRALIDPPRAVFHLVVGLFGVGLLWVGSSPGVPLVPLMWLGLLLAFGALIWAGKLVAYHRRRRKGVARPAGRWFLLAPIGGVLIAAVLASGLAFDVRWALSRASFDDAGFAYLPAGPTPEVEASFESLRTRQIDGSWYRWWSSW